MAPESPLRAQPDNRILAPGGNQYQGSLFDESQPANHDQEQLLADYRQRYGLAEDPFGDDYSFPFFAGGGRRQLIDRLLHLCQFSNSLMVVVGDYGVGKTRLAHALMDTLPEDDGVSYLPIKATDTTDELLCTIVEDLELPLAGQASAETALQALEEFMQGDSQEGEALAVVVIDNAHLLRQDSLQTFINLIKKYPKQTRLHCVLFGEPRLMEQLENGDLGGVLLNDFSLQPFTLGESVDYLNFRMEMADYLGPEIFTESMVSPWWRQAQGQLGILHELAQERLLESVTTSTAGSSKRGLPVAHIVAIAVLITIVGVLFLYMGDDKGQTTKPAVIVSSPVASVPNLTSTSTPVEPLMQSLPDVANTQTTQPSAATATQAPIAEEERIVPLAELSSRPAVTSAQSNQTATLSTAAPAPNPSTIAKPVVQEKTPVVGEPVKPQLPEVKKPVEIKQPVEVAKPIAPVGTTAQEKTILGWPANHFTIQLLGVSTQKAASDYVASQSNKTDLLIFKTKRQGKDWFVVITGHYPDIALARQAITRLPAAQRNAGPWPREIKVIQQEIKSMH